MGPVLHGRAKATHAIRVLKQRLKTSNAAPAGELGINVKTIAKRPKRDGVEDAHMHPKELRRAILSVEDKATTVAAYAIGRREINDPGACAVRGRDLLDGLASRGLDGTRLVISDATAACALRSSACSRRPCSGTASTGCRVADQAARSEAPGSDQPRSDLE